MHSPVPLAIAKVLAEKGSDVVAWARFNFRGVGASAGTYDEGRGEAEDARAVIEYLRAEAPGVPVSICGHSFGSWVGLRAAAADGGVERVLLVAPSARFFGEGERADPLSGERADPHSRSGPLSGERADPHSRSGPLSGERADPAYGYRGPLSIFLGDQDEFCDVEEGRELAARLGAELTIFEGYDHHFLKSRRAMAEAAWRVLSPET
jgi:pimeloyl-ACP methyl ester carboxylesterase